MRRLPHYIATLKLDSPPGQTQVYSNCGYYLLGRLAAKLRGTAAPIDAYRKHLMAPLGITRIRNAVDLLKAQPADEARYQAASFVDPDWTSDLAVAKSINSNDQPLVTRLPSPKAAGACPRRPQTWPDWLRC